MIVNVKVMTIAIKFDFGWRLDTYIRMPRTNKFITDVKFISEFEEEYKGNGIEEIKIIDSWENSYINNSISDFETMFKHLRENFDELNETILNY